jgi:hypothetical protein
VKKSTVDYECYDGTSLQLDSTRRVLLAINIVFRVYSG